MENWVSITDMAAGSMARRLTLNSRMGLTSEGKPVKPPLATFAGPGVAYQGFGEYGQRHWLSLWADCLSPGGGVTVGLPLPYGDPGSPGRAPVPGRGGGAARRGRLRGLARPAVRGTSAT